METSIAIPLAAALKAAELSTDDYHHHPAIAFSQLQRCGEWTEDERQWTPHEYATPVEETEAMRLGTLTHAAWYEPEKIAEMYAIRPEKIGKAVACNTDEFAKWALANEGKMHIRKGDLLDVHVMIEALRASPAVQSYTRKHHRLISIETPYIVTDPATGLQMRIKPDCLRLTPGGALICEDLKTTRAHKPGDFFFEARNHHYFRRMAFYRRALSLITGEAPESIRCVMVVVQKEAPMVPFVCEVSHYDLAQGDRENHHAMVALAKCIDSGIFLPCWAKEAFVL